MPAWRHAWFVVPDSGIVTLRTPDGFSVSFGVPAHEPLRMGTHSTSTNSDGRVIAN